MHPVRLAQMGYGVVQAQAQLVNVAAALAQTFRRMDQPRSQPVQALLLFCLAAFDVAGQLAVLLFQALAQNVAIRAEQFCRSGWCWCAQIGGKVGDGEICFVADTGDDRNA